MEIGYTGQKIPFSGYEISQQEFIRVAKLKYVGYYGGTTLFEEVQQRDPAALRPNPCGDWVLKDGAYWQISKVLEDLKLASDPAMCIIGGTAQAPLYVPCASPAHNEFLWRASTTLSPSFDDIAQELARIQQAVDRVRVVVEASSSVLQVFEEPSSSVPADKISITDASGKPVVSFTLSAPSLGELGVNFVSVPSITGFYNESQDGLTTKVADALGAAKDDLIDTLNYIGDCLVEAAPDGLSLLCQAGKFSLNVGQCAYTLSGHMGAITAAWVLGGWPGGIVATAIIIPVEDPCREAVVEAVKNLTAAIVRSPFSR